jgi:hypothetical protein
MTMDYMAKVDVSCHIEALVTVQAALEFGSKEELLEILQRPGTQEKLAKCLEDILAHTYDYTMRAPDSLRVGWAEDGNRDAYLREVQASHIRVKEVEIHSPHG